MALVVLVLIVTGQPSTAAVCAHWVPPEPVAVGSPAQLRFETYVPLDAGGGKYTLERHAFPDYRFRVAAVSPEGDEIPVEVHPIRSTDSWTGRFEPDHAGTWQLTIKNLAGISDDVCYSDVALVAHETEQPPWRTVALVAALVIILGASSALIMRRRSRSPASN